MYFKIKSKFFDIEDIFLLYIRRIFNIKQYPANLQKTLYGISLENTARMKIVSILFCPYSTACHNNCAIK